VKQIVKSLDCSEDCFGCIGLTFSGLSYKKKKAGIFGYLMCLKPEHCWRTTTSWLQWPLLRLVFGMRLVMLCITSLAIRKLPIIRY